MWLRVSAGAQLKQGKRVAVSTHTGGMGEDARRTNQVSTAVTLVIRNKVITISCVCLFCTVQENDAIFTPVLSPGFDPSSLTPYICATYRMLSGTSIFRL